MGITGYILFGVLGVMFLFFAAGMFIRNAELLEEEKATPVCFLVLGIGLGCLFGPYIGLIIKYLR